MIHHSDTVFRMLVIMRNETWHLKQLYDENSCAHTKITHKEESMLCTFWTFIISQHRDEWFVLVVELMLLMIRKSFNGLKSLCIIWNPILLSCSLLLSFQRLTFNCTRLFQHYCLLFVKCGSCLLNTQGS